MIFEIVLGVVLGSSGMSGLVIYYAKNPSKIDTIISIISKYMRFISDRFDKKHVEKDVESVINGYDGDLGYNIPYKARISWEKEIDKDSFRERDEVVICLDDSEHQTENVARAALAYTKKAVIPESRKFIKQEINKGINYTITSDMLENKNRFDAREELYNEIILPQIENEGGEIVENNLKESFDNINELKRGGLLGPVLLNEYARLTSYGVLDKKIREETRNLLEFLTTIAKKERGEDVDLKFEGSFFKVQIGLIAEPPIDIHEYSRACEGSLKSGYITYILAVGEKVEPAKKVAKNVSSLPIVREQEYITFELNENSSFGQKEAFCAYFIPKKR